MSLLAIVADAPRPPDLYTGPTCEGYYLPDPPDPEPEAEEPADAADDQSAR